MANKHFCLKWSNFQNSILNAFESLQVTEDLADVTLTCEGVNLKAHKFILSACSPYFRTVFKENPCPHPIVILKDVSYPDLIALVNFMYHGEVTVTSEQLPSFLNTAKLLQVSGLNNKAENTFMTYGAKRQAKGSEITPKRIKNKSISSSTNVSNVSEAEKRSECSSAFEHVEVDIKTEKIDDIDEPDVNENTEKPSILESVLDSKKSILERSLMSLSATKSSPQHDLSKLSPKSIDKHTESSPSHSCSPPAFDRPSDLFQQTLRIDEDDHYEITEVPPPITAPHYSVDTPHHSSQCGNCPHCGKVYSNQSALKYHVRLVHSDLTNMYCCHLCPEAFDFREGYKKHMAAVHSIRN